MVKYNVRSWWLTSASILFLQDFISCVSICLMCTSAESPKYCWFCVCISTIFDSVAFGTCLPSTLHVQEIKQFRSQADGEQRLKAKKTFHSSQFSPQCSAPMSLQSFCQLYLSLWEAVLYYIHFPFCHPLSSLLCPACRSSSWRVRWTHVGWAHWCLVNTVVRMLPLAQKV